MRTSKKKVYESIDIISQEMANQYFKDNRDKLSKEVDLEIETAKSRKENRDNRETNKEKIDHFEIKENIENIELEENLDLLLEYLMMKKKVLPQI